MLVAWREVGARMFRPSRYPLILLRGTVMCSAYTSYVTAMVAMPRAIRRSISRFRCRRPAQVGPLMHRFDCSAIIVDGSKKQSPGSRASGDFSTLTSCRSLLCRYQRSWLVSVRLPTVRSSVPFTRQKALSGLDDHQCELSHGNYRPWSYGARTMDIELTKRDFFAAVALHDMLSQPSVLTPEDGALRAVKAADALMRALETKPAKS
jgi:hypothetical protein